MSPEGQVRLFLALDLPSGAREALFSWGEGSLGEGLRQVGEADLHVTLAFLGWRPEAQAAQVWRAASEAAAGLELPRFEPSGVVAVPRRRPRLLALELADPTGAAAHWHDEVARALEAAGLFEPEKRPFWPHVTVARGRKGARVRAPRSEPGLEPFDAAALTLYRSDLSPAGARYTPLGSTGG